MPARKTVMLRRCHGQQVGTRFSGCAGRRWRVALATPLALIAALALAPPSLAKSKWVLWEIERSRVINCLSLIGGYPYEEVGALANAESYIDRRKLPRVGQTFYVRTGPAAVGRPCVNQQSVAIELVLPRGVKVAVSRRTPIRCFSLDSASKARRIGRSQGCPRRPGRGLYGPSFNRRGRPWPLPLGSAMFVEIPIRASRPFKGAAGGVPSCRRIEGQIPCRRDGLAHNLQFANRILDGNRNPWLAPSMPLFVRPR